MKNLLVALRKNHISGFVILLALGFNFTKSAAQCVTQPSGLVSWWRGENDATDFTGSNHGALINGATFATGKVGQAFSFDGVDDGINIQKSGNLDFAANDFSIGAWVNFTEDFPGPDAAGIFLNYAGLPFYGLFINPNGEVPNVYFRDGSGNEVLAQGTTPLNDGNWHYLVGIRDGQNGYLYVDGTLVATASNASIGTITTSSCTYARIGASITGPGHCTSASTAGAYFKGLIDEVEIYNRALSAAEIQAIYDASSAGKCTNTSPPVCVNPPSGLVSWWPGDNNANDIQNTNHGTLQNGTAFATGKVEQAFSFDGIDDVLEVNDDPSLKPANAITVDAWIYWRGPRANYNRIVTKRRVTSVGGISYHLVIIGNKLFWGINVSGGITGSAENVSDPNDFPTNSWHHVVGTYDGTNLKLYIDGIEVASRAQNGSIAYDTDPLVIGWYDTNFEEYFDGLIDEVEIFSRALSASEIQSIYNAGSAGKCKECTPPKVSITGNESVCPHTTHTYTANTDAANPSFEWFVTDGTINGDNTGNSVSVTAVGVGIMAVSLEVTDGATICSNSVTQEVTVEDTEAPVIGTISAPINPNQVNTLINASAGFTDACDANDHTAEWNWGDGNTSPGMVDHSANTVSGSHPYTTAGVYTLTLTVTDGAGNSDTEIFQFVAVYDPNAGYVTGGGWIESPAGAYPVNPSLTGKAHFGFVSRYQKGKSTPDGNTQFDFKMADLKFKSTIYDWLVISGPHAKYKGSGTINGQGDYGFMLFAKDGQVTGGSGVDRFRIKIWQKDAEETVVYDNQMGDLIDGNATDAIEGGNINIHSDGASKIAQEESASEAIPESYALEQNYPNPFNPSTKIAFSVKEAGVVELSIYNLYGQEVRTLINREMNAGFHSLNWDGKDERGQTVPSGVYLYKLRVNGFAQTRKMTFMK